MKTRYIYELSEVYNPLVNINPRLAVYQFLSTYKAVFNLSDADYNTILSNCPWAVLDNGTYKLTDNASQVIGAVLAKYWNSACVSSSEGNYSADVQEFWNKFLNILDFNWDYYNTLLSYYNEEKENLLKQVESTVSSTTSTEDSNTTSSTISHTNSGTAGGTDTLTLNTTEAVDGEYKKTGTDTTGVVYNSQVDTDRTATGSATNNGAFRDTPQIYNEDAPDVGDYVSSTTHSGANTSDTVDETVAKTGTDTTTLTHNTTDTEDKSTTRTGTETTQHSSTNSSTTQGTDSSTSSNEGESSTSSTSLDDRETLMMRLAEIQEHYKRIINEYCNRFSDLFWSVMNYEE